MVYMWDPLRGCVFSFFFGENIHILRKSNFEKQLSLQTEVTQLVGLVLTEKIEFEKIFCNLKFFTNFINIFVLNILIIQSK